MWDVVIALIPASVASIYFFGLGAVRIILVTVASALLTEFLIQVLTKKPITVSDGSAFITGLLLVFVLPPGIPLWMAALGGFIAIALGKQVFGGLGNNIFNPALVARAILLVSWPGMMTTWRRPFEAITTATPLAILKEHLPFQLPSYKDLFLGQIAGSLGETSALALLIGAIYLLAKRRITYHIPLSFVGSVALLTWIFGGEGFFHGDALFHILAGGLILGACFMATDPVTSPITPKGKLIMGIGCGIMVVLIRLIGGYPEGVCYSILLMNAFTPLIDRFTVPRRLGAKR
jgi:electron transport complex protein RnfD